MAMVLGALPAPGGQNLTLASNGMVLRRKTVMLSSRAGGQSTGWANIQCPRWVHTEQDGDEGQGDVVTAEAGILDSGGR